MGDNSAIEWTDATYNPIRARNRETGNVGHFCARISPGCVNCYAEAMQPRFGNRIRYAAQQLGRVGYGIEISPAYVDVACQRLEKHVGEPARKLAEV